MLFAFLLACSNAEKPAATEAPAPKEAHTAHRAAPGPAARTSGVNPDKQADVSALTPVTTASGLKYYVLAEGTGPAPTAGQTVAMHYAGWLQDGTLFDTSLKRGKEFTFPVGVGRVIKGWDEAVITMKVGERRQLHIPPELGYGERGAGGVIPPNATLVFDVELMGMK
jgi:FKBP-type peptidyl-prolyl cis-trans isomerase